jgi:hypothetical protein
MGEHSAVECYTDKSDGENYLFLIERNRERPPVLVHLSDAYFYGQLEYIARPSQLGRGDFILIARPEASYDEGIVAAARRNGIGIGKISKLMGALNQEKIWLYETIEEKKERERGRSVR